MPLRKTVDKNTPFELKVYRYLRKIPRGKITTYSLLAKAVGVPGGARAVGNALNKNPDAPATPCHRVVKADGTLGGYKKGKPTKMKLLQAEGVIVDRDKLVDMGKKLYKY